MTGRRVRGLGNLRFHQHFLILPHHLCFGQPHLPYKDLGLKIKQHDQDRDGVGGDEPEVLDPGLILPRAAGPAQRPPGRASFALFRSLFFWRASFALFRSFFLESKFCVVQIFLFEEILQGGLQTPR